MDSTLKCEMKIHHSCESSIVLKEINAFGGDEHRLSIEDIAFVTPLVLNDAFDKTMPNKVNDFLIENIQGDARFFSQMHFYSIAMRKCIKAGIQNFKLNIFVHFLDSPLKARKKLKSYFYHESGNPPSIAYDYKQEAVSMQISALRPCVDICIRGTKIHTRDSLRGLKNLVVSFHDHFLEFLVPLERVTGMKLLGQDSGG